MEREAQMEGLLTEADRQTRTDRGTPRWCRFEELDAEARGPKEGKRKAGKSKKLLNCPKKGSLMNLTDARKRWLVRPMSGSPRAMVPTAVLKSRPLLVSRWMRRKGTVLMDLARFRDYQEVFGMR